MRSQAGEPAETRCPGLNLPDPSQSRIDQYLDAVFRAQSDLAPEVRAERRREMAVHLETLVEAWEELGQSRPEAVTSAIRQFGKAEELRAELAQEVRAPSGGRAAVTAALLVWCAGFGLYLLGPGLYVEGPFALLGAPLIPLAVGAAAGYFFRKRRNIRQMLLGLFVFAGGLSLLTTTGPDDPTFITGALLRALLWVLTGASTCGLGLLASEARRRKRAPVTGG
jgi:hypothetical protein